jgi:hypothetical protein
MDCITANIVGAFALTIIFFDIFKENWTDLPYHSLYGIIVTGFFWVLCTFLGKEISMAVLLVPALILLVSFISIWLYGISMKNKGCCLQCNGINPCPNPDPNPQPGPFPPGPIPCKYSGELKATPLV